MHKYILIIFCLLIFFIINNITSPNNENFDAKIKDKIKLEQCGTICTETVGCSAFVFDPIKNSCYLARDLILNNEPERGIYIDDFNTDQIICNKLVPIPELTDDVLTENKRLNMFYTCLGTKDKCSTKYDTYKIVNDQMKKIDKRAINDMPYEDYYVNDIKWPLNTTNELIYKKTYPEKNFIFKKTDKQYEGEYLYPHKCTMGISEKECTDSCYKNPQCSGFEFNPVYLKKNNDGSFDMSENVCCPYKKKGNEIYRTDEHKFGKFYEKQEVHEMNTGMSHDNPRVQVTAKGIVYQ